MKNAKRWLAILLAVTLLCSNGVSQLGMIVSASELETTEEAQPKEDAVVEQAEETKEDTGKATVEGVTPEEERGESSAQDAETANVPKAAAQEGQNEANVPEAAPATVAPTTVAPTTATPATVTPATAVPASEGAGQAEEAAAPEVQTYNVKINKSELDGGQIKAWGSDNNKVDVTEYDGNNQYVKEVKEGEEFNFQITLNDGFEIAQVKVNGNAFDPANTEGNVITYKVAGINEEKVIDVTYNKVETPAEKKAAEEPKTEDETKVEEPAAEETAEPEDNSVNTASLNENVSTVANTDTNRTVRVGQTITLDSKNVEKGLFNYTHEWTVNDNTIVRLNTTSGTSITVTGLKAGETIVTDAYTKQSIFGLSNGKKTYTITVRSAVTPTNITIEGSDKVTQFQTMQLTAKLTPADADGTVTWSSSNEQILSVDDKGVVTGRRQGEATVTASVQGTAVSTTKKITVEQDTATKGTKATVYFLLDPTKDPNSNDQSEWGEAYGTAVVNLENAKWVNDKNCFEDVDQRVISWPKGTNIIPRNSKEWDQIFNNYQATLKAQFGELQFSKDDVEEITLVPAKISKNNGTTSTSLATHLDCSVNIKCKNIALVKYYLFDAGGTGYVQQGSQNYIINDSAKTDPKSVIGNDFPETKTVSGVTYTFSGWYTDQSLTKPAPEFPAKVTASVDYYAKYIAGYQVMYNLAGGKFSDGSTSATEKHNVDTMVVVREQPTRAGYKFTGWTVEGLGETTSLNSGATFTMPNGNVTLTAKWEEQKIEEFLTLVPKDVSKPYDGTELQAGTAKVTGKVEGADTASVKIEYSLNGKDWTTNPSEVTATNVSDSKTVQVRATSEKYTGELTGTEELTITPKPVTVTANSYNKTYGASDPEFTVTVVGTLGTDKVTYNLSREAGEDVGTYPITASGDAIQGNYNVTYHPGTLTITAATRPEDRQPGVTSYEGVYDANDHTITVDNVLDGDVVEYSYDGGETWTTNLNQYKDVTETTIKVRVTNANYDPSPVELEGTVKITPKPVTVTANSYNKAYGATDPTFTAKVEGTLGTDAVNYILNRETGENVGTYKILAIGDATQGNYSVTYYPGTLTITAATRPEDKQLSVTSYEGVYDANEHTITVDNVLDGDVVEYSYDGGETWTTNLNQYKDVTETTIKVRVTNANYDPSPVELEGTVKITPKPVTVTANSDSKTYGAVDPEFTATVVGTLGTDKVTYSLSREAGEDVGEYLITASGDVAQGNYSVRYNPGTLTIVASDREKAVEVASYNGVYDAKKHTIEVKNLERGDLVKYSYDNGTTWEDELKEYTDVTAGTTILVQVMNDNYAEVPKLTGTVTITPKPVTVTANSDSKTYGAADPEFTVTVVGTLGTDKVTYNLSREAGEDVGTYPITASGDAIQGNYNVTYHPGTLTITAATRPEDRQPGVTSYEGVYDANDHTITVDNVLDGDVVEYSYDGGETWTTNLNQYKDVTETTIKVRVTNANYDPSPVELEGTVKITPKPVTVTANSYNKAYGATDPEFTVTVEGTLGSDTVNYKLNRETGEDVGTYKILAIGDAAQGNYSVTYYPGTLTITAATRPEDRQLGVTSYEGVYDANDHTITVDNVLDGDVVEYSYDGGETWTTNLNQYKDVTETTIKVRVTNANYDPSPVELEGTVKITPKPVTVTANSYNKAYGATDPEFTVTVEGTLGSDTVNYKLNRETGEDVGTYKILAIGDAAQGNYSVTYYPGTLTITAATRPEDRQLGVTSYEGVYDANEHTITVDNVLDGDVVEYSYDGGETWTTNLNQYKDVTETTIKVRVTNANYDPSPVELEGTVKITPATLTVSTPIATKVYEGTPLTAAGTISGFVNGETATFTTTGSQTEVGSTANTYSLTWDGTAKESNYTVAETIGTLTVTAQSIDPENPDYKGITVDAPTDVEYTGEDQTWLPTVTDGNGKALVKDTDYTVTYDNEDRTNVTGIITVTINGAGNYAGTITRTYQITPKPVTITTESKTRAFDGTALTAGGKVEGIVSGETYGFKTTGSQTYVGSSQNTYEMVWADSEVEGTSGTYTAKKTNYTVTESIGTLVVTAGTPENPLDPTLVVNKTHDKSQTYKAGDVITFTITAKNIYEEAKTITLEELEGVALDANVFENVASGAEVTATATYTVTEQDIVNGTFTNNVTVTFSGVDDKFTGTDTVDELEDANPHMTITKTTVGAEEGHIYKLNDVINYKITATNDGNLTLTNVKVEDALTGNVGENAFTIDILAPGEAQTFDVRYVVTENDVLEGKVINNATGTATDPTDPDESKTPITPGEKEDPIETPNPSLAVVKTSDKTGVVKLGETITYTITVTNNGNVTINDIEVTDELTGNTGDNAFTIDRLAVGETKQFTATYTVTEDDILEGTIVNRATATGKDPRNEEVTGEGEVRVDTEEKDDSKKDDSKKDDSKKNDSDKKPGAVKTGDATDVIPFFGMTVLAAGAAIVIALKKKRRA